MFRIQANSDCDLSPHVGLTSGSNFTKDASMSISGLWQMHRLQINALKTYEWYSALVRPNLPAVTVLTKPDVRVLMAESQVGPLVGDFSGALLAIICLVCSPRGNFQISPCQNCYKFLPSSLYFYSREAKKPCEPKYLKLKVDIGEIEVVILQRGDCFGGLRASSQAKIGSISVSLRLPSYYYFIYHSFSNA